MTMRVIEVYEGEYLFYILLYEFEHITKKGGMCVIEVSISQSRVDFMDQR